MELLFGRISKVNVVFLCIFFSTHKNYIGTLFCLYIMVSFNCKFNSFDQKCLANIDRSLSFLRYLHL